MVVKVKGTKINFQRRLLQEKEIQNLKTSFPVFWKLRFIKIFLCQGIISLDSTYHWGYSGTVKPKLHRILFHAFVDQGRQVRELGSDVGPAELIHSESGAGQDMRIDLSPSKLVRNTILPISMVPSVQRVPRPCTFLRGALLRLWPSALPKAWSHMQGA